MLATPPPGYNTSSVNVQNVGQFNIPGQQGALAQGYLNNPYRSSFATPSSYAVPSSVPQPDPWFTQPHPANAAMVQALMRGR